jgi:hypothetical protein
LTTLAREDPVVIALPPGGVPVGFEVAQRLRAPLDVLTVAMLAVPGRSELAVGATAENGTDPLVRAHRHGDHDPSGAATAQRAHGRQLRRPFGTPVVDHNHCCRRSTSRPKNDRSRVTSAWRSARSRLQVS